MAHPHPCACCGPASERDEDAASAGLIRYCPTDGVIETLRKKYVIEIIALLGAEAPLRYGEIKARVGTSSDSTLSHRLEELTDDGVVARKSHDEIPPRVEYSLTDEGRELETRLEPVLAWGLANDE